MLKARILPAVSQLGCLALTHARIPEALPTVTAAAAAHCMHMG
jgi:hypothetical protein